MYKDVQLFIDGKWVNAVSGKTIPVINPATEAVIGKIAHAEKADLDLALAAAQKGFETWRKMSAYDRSKLMRKAADILRSRIDEIATIMTMEQGKPIGEAKIEVASAADIIDWCAEESRRTYGRLIPARAEGIYQMAIKEPVGPVAAFTPWNFPINQVVRKLSAALAAGCSFIVKAPEETPGSPAELIRAFADAGIPDGVVNLVYGVPAEISEYLIAHPIIRKISFTGSTPVGKMLASMAGKHMKRATMELGGHAPAVVFDDAAVDAAVKMLAGFKFRNAGQVCISPTRFLVQKGVYDKFVDQFVSIAKSVKVGDGLDPATRMGPLANERRIPSLQRVVDDAVKRGAKLHTGGKRIGDKGYFYEPTVLSNLPLDSSAMNDEPFGPIALMVPFDKFEDAVKEANRLLYGLASYAFTSSAKTAAAIGAGIEAGMVGINSVVIALPETPFGGVKDSGYGHEGGIEAIEAYVNTKFVSQAGV
ncbi:MAG: NAD-dependent succinate-semialdehyde dehydrogenase [Candidatus Protistobacter heckmanni]|nr:NAD-dependent succinate-semialdehyde dehydrogenase [Candidatus Protistobacter heckmanni]